MLAPGAIAKILGYRVPMYIPQTCRICLLYSKISGKARFFYRSSPLLSVEILTIFEIKSVAKSKARQRAFLLPGLIMRISQNDF
jgi:hypothetical protein